ncbi:hypothetical protein [Hydrogenophaga sp.]|uniref:DUF6950 family protein n=1 Tax=Hydrogenophaga sp. TaxID=1904254 RepID=UPI00272F6731|nr:hypothetical protein [Hydrogenophaga sp.]MDP1686889.1 hypothetical protein [Hydrogenophaga sp.]
MRLLTWPTRYAELCSERITAPFEWGVNDCCLWAADCVEALTGVDYAAAWRGTYSAAAGAARLMDELGGVRAIATGALGDAVSPLLAGVGDLVLIEQGGREMLGVCNGAEALVVGPAGLEAVSMPSARAAWRV